MSSQWNYLRVKMATGLGSARAFDVLRELHLRYAFLERFPSPVAVTEELAVLTGDARNQLLASLISAWRAGRESRELLASILIVGLWRDLDLVHQSQSAVLRKQNIEELEALLIFHFLRAVDAIPLERSPDLGQSLVRTARRDATRALSRGRRRPEHDAVIAQLLVAATSDVPTLAVQISEPELRNKLQRIIRSEDVDLLVEAYLHERPHNWLAERFRRTVKAINKRLHRVLSRLRRYA
jgi:hypothetical protein